MDGISLSMIRSWKDWHDSLIEDSKTMKEEHRTIRRRFAVINEPFNAGEGMELQAGVEFRLTRPSRADVLKDGSLLIKPAQGPDIRVPESGYHVREEIEEIYIHPRKE